MTADRPSTREERAAYRRWIRDHHPDVGGDPEEFAIGLARLRAGVSRAAWGGAGRFMHPEDRYDAPIEIVPDHQRMRAALQRLWRRFRPPDPPRVR